MNVKPSVYSTYFISVSAAALVSASAAVANPSGPNVVSGSVDINGLGTSLVVIDNNSNRAIVNWDQFSIGAGETTQINQLGAGAAILNRVTGSNLSEIYGTLSSNGQVYLINENGIIIGADGVIDTTGFVASTLNATDADFLGAGDMLFSQGVDAGGGISVLGKIRSVSGGDIFLLSREIEIGAEAELTGGYVGLGAGEEILLRPVDSGEGRISIKAGAGKITNKGNVEGAVAELRAAGGNEYALAINNSGVVRATGASTSGGRVTLTAGGAVEISGKVEARKQIAVRSTAAINNSGEVTGSEIIFEAPEITIEADSLLDVSAALGGGRVFIGGGYKGKATDHAGNAIDLTKNATKVVVSHGARIDATGGGEVVVWSDGSTDFAGDIVATSATGKGGNAEVSGKSTLIFNGTANLRGAAGFGTLLLDPGTVTIKAGSGFNNVNTFHADTINGLLNDADVTILTADADSSLPGGAPGGDIILESGVRINWNSNFFGGDGNDFFNAKLTLRADRDIIAANDVLIQNYGFFVTAENGANNSGGVLLSAGRNVLLGSDTMTSAVQIGSVFGTTEVYAGVGPASEGPVISFSSGSNYTTVNQTGSVILKGGKQSGAFAQIGASGELIAGSGGNIRNGDIIVKAGTDVILTSGGASAQDEQTVFTYAQIGHGGTNTANVVNYDIDGDIDVVSGIFETGDVTLINAEGASFSSYAQIGHGLMTALRSGATTDSDISGNVAVTAYNDGDINVGTSFVKSQTGAPVQNMAQIGHGSHIMYQGVAITGDEVTTGRIQGDIFVNSFAGSTTETSATGKVQVGAAMVSTDEDDDSYAIDAKIGHGANVFMNTWSDEIAQRAQVKHGAIDGFAVYRGGNDPTYLTTNITVNAGEVKILANETAKNSAGSSAFAVDNGMNAQIGSGATTTVIQTGGDGVDIQVDEALIAGNISVKGVAGVTVESTITAGDIAITNDGLVARLGHGGTALLTTAASRSLGDINVAQANIYKSAISVTTETGDITVNSKVTAGLAGVSNSDALAVIGSGGQYVLATGDGLDGTSGFNAGDIRFAKGTVWDGIEPGWGDRPSGYSAYDTSITLTSGAAINITTAQAAGLAAITSNTSQSGVGHGAFFNLTTGSGGDGSMSTGGRGGDVLMFQQQIARDYGFVNDGEDDYEAGLRGNIRLNASNTGDTAITIDSQVASALAGANNATAVASVGHGDQIAVVAGNGGNGGNGSVNIDTAIESAPTDRFEIQEMFLFGGRGGHVDLQLGRRTFDGQTSDGNLTTVMLIEGDITINVDGALAVTSAANNALAANNNALLQSQIGHNMHVTARSGNGGNGGASKVGVDGVLQGVSSGNNFSYERNGESNVFAGTGTNRGGNGGDLRVLLGDITDRYNVEGGFSHETDADSGRNGSDIEIYLNDYSVDDALILTATVGAGAAEGQGADVNALIGHNYRILAEGGKGGNGGSANTQFDNDGVSLYRNGAAQTDSGDDVSSTTLGAVEYTRDGGLTTFYYVPDGFDETAGQAGVVFRQPNTSGGRGGDALAVTGNIRGDITVEASSRVTVSTLAGHGGSGQVAAQIGHSTNLFVTTQSGGNAGTMYEPGPGQQQASFDGGIKPSPIALIANAWLIDGNKDDAFDMTNLGWVDVNNPDQAEDGISITTADKDARVGSTMSSILAATVPVGGELTAIKDFDLPQTNGVIFHDEEADPEYILGSDGQITFFVRNNNQNNAQFAASPDNLKRFGRLVATYDAYSNNGNDLDNISLPVFVDLNGDGAVDLVDFDRDGRLDIVDVDGDGIMDQIDGRANYVGADTANSISGLGVLDYVAVTGRNYNGDNATDSWSLARNVTTNDKVAAYYRAESNEVGTVVGDFATANGGRGGDAAAINGYTVGDISISTVAKETAGLVVSSNAIDDVTAGTGDDIHRAMIGHAGVNLVDTNGDMRAYIAGRATDRTGALAALTVADGGDASNYAVTANGGRGGNATSIQGVARDNNGGTNVQTEVDHLVGNVWINTPNRLDSSRSVDAGQVVVAAKAETDLGGNSVLAQLGHFAYAWATGAAGGNGASQGFVMGPSGDSQTEIADGGAGGVAIIQQAAIKGGVTVMAGQTPEQTVSLVITAENGAAFVPPGPSNTIISQLGHGRAAQAFGGAGGNGDDGQASGNGGLGGDARIGQDVIIDANILVDLVDPAALVGDTLTEGYYGRGMLLSAKDLEAAGGITRAQVGHGNLALAVAGAGGDGATAFEVVEQINQTANGGAGGAADIWQGAYHNNITLDIGSNGSEGDALEVFASENNLFDGVFDHTLATIGHGGYAAAYGGQGGAGGLSGVIDGINSDFDYNLVDSDYNYTGQTTNQGEYSIDWENILTLGTERSGGAGGAATILQGGTGVDVDGRGTLDYGVNDTDGAAITITINDYLEGGEGGNQGPAEIDFGADGVLVHAVGGAGLNATGPLFINAALIGHSTFAEAVGGNGGDAVQGDDGSETISKGDGGDGGDAEVTSGRIIGDITVSNVTTNAGVKNGPNDLVDYNDNGTAKSTNIVFSAVGGSPADSNFNTVMARAGHFSQIATTGGAGGKASTEAGAPPSFTATLSAQGGHGGSATTQQDFLQGNITLTAENSVKQLSDANNGAAAISTVTAIGHGQSATAVAGAGGQGGTAGDQNLYFIYEALREFHARGGQVGALSQHERNLIAPVLKYFNVKSSGGPMPINGFGALEVFLDQLIGSTPEQIAANMRDDDNIDGENYTIATLDGFTQNGQKTAAATLMAILAASGHGGGASVEQGSQDWAAIGDITINALSNDLTDGSRGYDQTAMGSASVGGAAITQLGHTVNLLQAAAGAGANLSPGNAGANGIGGNGGDAFVLQSALVGAITVNSEHKINILATDKADGAYQVASYVGHRQMLGSDIVAQRAATVVIGGAGGGETADAPGADGLNGNGGNVSIAQFGHVSSDEFSSDIRLLALSDADDSRGITIESSATAVGDPDVVTHIGHQQFIASVKAGDAGRQGGLTGPEGAQGLSEGNGGSIFIYQDDLGADIDIIARDAIAITAKGVAPGAETAYLLIGHQRTVGASANSDSDQTGTIVAGAGGDSIVETGLRNFVGRTMRGDANSGGISINLGSLGDSADAGSRLVTITSITEDVDILAEAALGIAMLEIGNQQQVIAETLEAGNYNGLPQVQTAGDSGSIQIVRSAISGDIVIQALDADREDSNDPAVGKQVTVISKTAIGRAQVQIGQEAEYTATTGRSGFGVAEKATEDLEAFLELVPPFDENGSAVLPNVEGQATFTDALAAVQNMESLGVQMFDAAQRFDDRLPASDAVDEYGLEDATADQGELMSALLRASAALSAARDALDSNPDTNTLETNVISLVFANTQRFLAAAEEFKAIFASVPGGADVVATYADAGDITYVGNRAETTAQNSSISSGVISGDVILTSGQYDGDLAAIVGNDAVLVNVFGDGTDDESDGVVLVKSESALGNALTEIGHRNFMVNTTGIGGGDTNTSPEEGGVAGDGGSITLSNETSGNVTLRAEEVVVTATAADGRAETHLGHSELLRNGAGSSDIQTKMGQGGDIMVSSSVTGEVFVSADYLASDVDAQDRTLKVQASPGTAYLQMGHQVANQNESRSDPNEAANLGDGPSNKGANRGGAIDLRQIVAGNVNIALGLSGEGEADLIISATGDASANLRLGHSGQGHLARTETSEFEDEVSLTAYSGAIDSDDGDTIDLYQSITGDVVISNIEDLAIRAESIGSNEMQIGHSVSQLAFSGQQNAPAGTTPAYGEAVLVEQYVGGTVSFDASSSFEASLGVESGGKLQVGHFARQTARSADDGGAPSDVDPDDNGASAAGVNDSFDRPDVGAVQIISGDISVTSGEIILSNGSTSLLQLGHLADQRVAADGDDIALTTTGSGLLDDNDVPAPRVDNPFAGQATGYVTALSVINSSIDLTATGATGQVDTVLVSANGTQGDITLTQIKGAGGVQVGHRSLATISDATPEQVAEGFYLTLQAIGGINGETAEGLLNPDLFEIDSSLATITLTAAQDIEMLGIDGGVIEVGHYIQQAGTTYSGSGLTSPVAVNGTTDEIGEDSQIVQLVASDIALNAGNNVVMTSKDGTTLVGHSSLAANQWQVEDDRSVTLQVLGGAISVISGLDTAADAPNGATTSAGDESGLGDDMLLDGTAGGSVRIGHNAPAIGISESNATQIAFGDIWVKANGDLAVKTASIGHANYDFEDVAVSAANATPEGLAAGNRDRIVGNTTIGAGQNSPEKDSIRIADVMVLDKAMINSGYGGIEGKDTGGKLRFFLPSREGLTITESVFNDSASNGDAVPDRVSNAGNIFTAEGGNNHEHSFALMSNDAAYTDQYIGAGNFTFYFGEETAPTVDTPYVIYTPTAGRFTAFTVQSRGSNGVGTGSAINIGNLNQTSVSNADSTVPENCDSENVEACVTQEYNGVGATQNSGIDDQVTQGLIPVSNTNPTNFMAGLLQSLRSSLFGGNNI